LKCKENKEIAVFAHLDNISLCFGVFTFWLTELNAFGWNCQMHYVVYRVFEQISLEKKKTAVDWV
jgi:hypothetical protein